MKSLTEFPKPHYIWPYIGEEQNKAINLQLNTCLSIRDNSGIVGEFEQSFANFIGSKHAVSFSSGTSALHAMCVAASLSPGDEILCPVYTFFATITPFVYEGIKPIFCDSDAITGNISIDDMEKKITHNTKAVIVTHMWGHPCDMTKITEFCKKHSLYLFEDCSHAHFAQWQGKNVGTFGDMSAFSLNQKVITTGEGGVLVTNNEEFKDRALLFGHYNFRCKREINKEKPYYKYALTGMGLKHRAHPLGLALGVNQLKNAKSIEEKRRRNLEILSSSVSPSSALKALNIDASLGKHGLYVVIFQFDKTKSSITREELVAQFHQAGAFEMDIPGSTCLLHKEPLFNHKGMLRHDKSYVDVPLQSSLSFPQAQSFYESAIKCPLWGYPGDEEIVEAYAKCITEISQRS